MKTDPAEPRLSTRNVFLILPAVVALASGAQAFDGDLTQDYTVNGSGFTYAMEYDAAALGQNDAATVATHMGVNLALTSAETEAFTGDAWFGIDGATLTLNDAVVNMSNKDRTGSSKRGLEFYNGGTIVLNDSYLGVNGINKKDDTPDPLMRGSIYLNGSSILDMTADGGGERWSPINIYVTSSWTGFINYRGWNEPTAPTTNRGAMFRFFLDGSEVPFDGNFQIGGNNLVEGIGNHYTADKANGFDRLEGVDDDGSAYQTRYIQLDGAAPATEIITPSEIQLTITPNAGAAGTYDFTWDSKAGKVYDLVSHTDLSTAPSGWPVWMGNENIAGIAPENTLEAPGGADPTRFFAVIEKEVLSEDFEGGVIPATWTATVVSGTGTAWEVGDPTGGFSSGPAAASSGSNCAGTNIPTNGGHYSASVDVTLTSPSIAIPAGSGATLSFQQFIDTDFVGDFGSVRVLDAGTNLLIGDLEITNIEGDGGAGWTPEELVMTAVDVGGKNIKIEFQFVSDESTEFAGFYIDEVEVAVDAP